MMLETSRRRRLDEYGLRTCPFVDSLIRSMQVCGIFIISTHPTHPVDLISTYMSLFRAIDRNLRLKDGAHCYHKFIPAKRETVTIALPVAEEEELGRSYRVRKLAPAPPDSWHQWCVIIVNFWAVCHRLYRAGLVVARRRSS